MSSKGIIVSLILSQIFSVLFFEFFQLAFFSYFLMLPALFSLLLAAKERDSFFLYFALFFISGAFFIALLDFTTLNHEKIKGVFASYTEKERVFVAVLSESPDKRADKSYLILRICENKLCALAKADYRGYQELKVGDTVKVSGVLELPETFSENFNYPKFLESKDILFNLKIHSLDILKKGSGLYRTLQEVKNTLSESFYKILDFDNAALASGIMLGEKQALLPDTQDVFKKSGLMHIVVLSGYNISMIATGVFYALFFLSRGLRAFFAIIIVSIFVIMVGADTPALRAGFMGALAFFAIAVRRPRESLHFLFLSFMTLTLLRPFAVLYDPGFQMSFVVTLAIILFAQKLGIVFINLNLPKALSELLSTTIVALLSVSPLLAYYMSQVSLSAFFANILVLPLVPLAMFFVFATFLSYWLFVPASVLFAAVANFLLSVIYSLAKFFASSSLAAIHLQLSAPYLFLLYLALLFYALYIYMEEKD